MRFTVPYPPVPPHPAFPPGEPAPRAAAVQLPMVYVAPLWEYKHLYRAASGDVPPVSEEELNALGAEGWELTGVIPGPSGVHLYFKRSPM